MAEDERTILDDIERMAAEIRQLSETDQRSLAKWQGPFEDWPGWRGVQFSPAGRARFARGGSLLIGEEAFRDGFTAVPNSILFATNLSRDARLSYAILLRHAQQGRGCWPGMETLSAELQATEDSVRRWLKELERVGLLTSVRRGLGMSNIYYLWMTPRDLLRSSVEPDNPDPNPEPRKTRDQQPLKNPTLAQTPRKSTGPEPEFSRDQEPEFDGDEERRREERRPSVPLNVPSTDLELAALTPGVQGGNQPQKQQSEELRRVNAVFGYYRQKVQPSARLCPTDKLKARLKRWSVEELKAGIDRFAADSWWMEHNATRGATWFFASDARSEQFLNLRPRTHPGGDDAAARRQPARGGQRLSGDRRSTPVSDAFLRQYRPDRAARAAPE